MRVLLAEQLGDPGSLRVGERGMPEPGPDEILVRVLAAGVGPWDVEQLGGGWKGPLPYVPGAQFAGLVVGDTGSDAGFNDGAPVYGWPGPGGCCAQYVTCHVERLAPLPAGLRVTDAAAVPVGALTADQGINGILAVKTADRVLITAAAGGLGQFAVQMARALGAIVVGVSGRRDHELVHRLGAAMVVDQTAPDWPDQVREMTDGGADKVLACSAVSLPGTARAARGGATIATPVRAGLPDARQVTWRPYEGRPSGSRLIWMAPRFDDGRLSVSTPAMYFWQEAAQAYRRVERADSSGQAVLIVDEDLAATLEV